VSPRVNDWLRGYEQFWLQKLGALGRFLDHEGGEEES